MPLMPQITDRTRNKEFAVISTIIDTNPTICDRILQYLSKGDISARCKGARMRHHQNPLRSPAKYTYSKKGKRAIAGINDMDFSGRLSF
jgi:hypothetical protein